MKFAFTSFDKAILAAVLTPLLGLAINWAGGGEVDEKTIIAAVVAGLVAGLGVYLKGNADSAPAVPVVAPVPPSVPSA